MKHLIEQVKPQNFFSQRDFLKEKYYSTLSFIDFWAKAYGELSFLKTCLIHSVFLSTGVTLFCFIPSAGILFLSLFVTITMSLAHHFKNMENRFNKLTVNLKDVDEIVNRMQKTVIQIVNDNDAVFEKQILNEKELAQNVEAIAKVKGKITDVADSFILTLNDIDNIKQRLQSCESRQNIEGETSFKSQKLLKDEVEQCLDYLDKMGRLSLQGLFAKPDLSRYQDLLDRCELIEQKI